MNYLKAILMIGVLSLFMGGCARLTPPPKIITQEKTVFVEPPPSLYQDCHVSAPPVSLAVYMSYDKYGPIKAANLRAHVQTEYIKSLLHDLGDCNVRKQSLRAWYVKAKKVYQVTSTKTKP